jgi:hypothetical protein
MICAGRSKEICLHPWRSTNPAGASVTVPTLFNEATPDMRPYHIGIVEVAARV